MNRKKSILFFIGSPAIFCFSLSPARIFRRAYGGNPRGKFPTEIRPAKAFHAGKTLGEYLPLVPAPHPTAMRKGVHRPERYDTSREKHLPAVPARDTVSATAKRPGSHRETGSKNRTALPHSARVFRPAFLLESGTARSAEARDRFPVHGDTRRQNPDRANESVETRCRPISANASAARTFVRTAP